VYWSSTSGSNDWTIRAGFSSPPEKYFDRTGSGGATAGTPTGIVSGNYSEYEGLIGDAQADVDGKIKVYIDDKPPTSANDRTFYDGIRYYAPEERTDLIAYWPFDEGTGTTLHDIVSGHDGTIWGDPKWGAGVSGLALEFDGSGDLVRVPYSAALQLRSTGQYTVAAWVYVVNTSGGLILFSGQGCVTCANWYLGVRCAEDDAPLWGGANEPNNFVFGVRRASGWGPPEGGWVHAPIVPETWQHVAATYDGSTLILYIDGQVADSNNAATLPWDNTTMPFSIGGDTGCTAVGRYFFTGKIDDLQIYNVALWQDEIQDIMTPTSAWKPNPADRASGVGANPTLSWKSGKYTAKHNVYFGTTSADVTAATAINHPNVQVSLNQDPNSYVPPSPLVLGQTYYWRVDEVNDVQIWPGSVWSFTAQPLTAYFPSPVDGAKYLDPNIVLSWSPGLGAKSHHVYFGTSKADVAAGTGGTDRGTQATTTLTLDSLVHGTTYYWRIDEVPQTGPTVTGDTWSFSIIPDIPISDPSLVGWWKLDEGVGTRAVDWSGYNRHGTIYGGPIWVDGFDGGALEFDGVGNYVDLPIDAALTSLTSCTISTWVDYFPRDVNDARQRIFSFANTINAYMTLTPRLDPTTPFMSFAITTTFSMPGAEANRLDAPSALPSGWHHVAVVIDGVSRNMQLYLDGTVVAEGTTQVLPADLTDVPSCTLGKIIHGMDSFFTGMLDDFRIYNMALTQERITKVMRIDPLRAWNPIPSNGALTDVEKAFPLSWSPGDEAVNHDVYFGTDALSVESANISDTTGIYRGRQDANSYTSSVEPNQVYYWRIDEFNTDGTITIGRVWSFTVAQYLIVDNFEYYDDVNNQIYLTWEDYFVNNTGMTVGHFEPPYAETQIVHLGSQAMYMHYDNDGTVNEGIVIDGVNYERSGTQFYSEAQRTWAEPQDWTRKGANSLMLWFRGIPPTYGSFVAGPPTWTLTARGTDIWNEADEFFFAYKQLSGEGSITARVDSITNTDPWAKAGVMIRESLEPGSVHAMIVVTPGSGVSFQRRTVTGSASDSTTEAEITAPQWVRLTRSGNTFTADYSATGTANSWTTLGSVEMPMAADVYVGLCLTSHNVNATCTAEFSNVNNLGIGNWQSQDIGIAYNEAEQIYVMLQDSAGISSPAVKYPDPAATTFNTWTEWNIPFTAFTGVNLQSITKLSIGVGDRANPQLGGAGDLYIDDIGLKLP
jgi:regulation of enolase protein 1 (concanavalin A-like superfamily)